MPQEPVNLVIVGGLISLISTLLTLIVTYLFQQVHDEKIREWEQQDKEAAQYREIYIARLKEVEAFVHLYFEIINKLLVCEITLVNSEYPKQDYQELLNINPALEAATKNYSSFQFINDPELVKLSGEIMILTQTEYHIANEIFEKLLKKEPIDKEVELKRIWQFYNSGGDVRANMIKRIDYLFAFGIKKQDRL